LNQSLKPSFNLLPNSFMRRGISGLSVWSITIFLCILQKSLMMGSSALVARIQSVLEQSCRTGSDFLTTILILASSLEPYVSIPRSLPRMSPRMSRMSHRVSHRISKYLFPLPNDDVVVILFATYLSPIWCIYRGSRALFNRQSSHTWLSVQQINIFKIPSVLVIAWKKHLIIGTQTLP